MGTPTAVHGVTCGLTSRRAWRGNQVTVTVAIACDERFDEGISIGADEREATRAGAGWVMP